MNDLVITPATPDDAPAVLELLGRSHLPTAGLLEHLSHTLVARDGRRIVGTAAVEVYQDGALLRSVAVDSPYRGVGLGQRLTNAALKLVEEKQLEAVYLLTTTAEQFFPRFGFEEIRRTDVPASVQASVEFTSACPATAIAMRKRVV
jgi:amino-acid N-acetyltransferase